MLDIGAIVLAAQTLAQQDTLHYGDVQSVVTNRIQKARTLLSQIKKDMLPEQMFTKILVNTSDLIRIFHTRTV